jgi:hydrogenase small subunit
MLRATKPTIAEIVLDVISLEYHETIMAPSGHAAEKSKKDVLKNHKGKYIAIVEGAIPMKDEGIYCTIGGHSALDIAREVCENALTTLAVGSCASWGGVASANPNPTGCVGVKEAVPNATVVNLPGCPVNVENITATIVHFLTFGSLPARDARLRPLFGYGKRIHDNCERRMHFDAGHPCFACASNNNWDVMGSIYTRLPNVPGASYQATADKIGLGLAALTGAGIAVAHAWYKYSDGDDKAKHPWVGETAPNYTGPKPP